MGFLSPWFLCGLAAIGLPIYIHLLRRHSSTPLPFSSLMFFEKGTQSSTRHRRLRYLLLFALRAAMLLLLVLAFANPFVRLKGAGANGKLLLVVVDNSFSMRAGSRFAEAKQGALALLAARPRSQRATVMALGGRLAILTQPIDDAGVLQAAVESIEPSDGRGNLGELARGVRALAQTVQMPIELHLFSDMQKTAMPANFEDMQLPPQVAVVLHPVGAAATPNWTVESVAAPAQLADPKDPKTSRLQAVIAGFGTVAATKTVSFLVNGKTVASRTVPVPANGRATVEFKPLEVPYGLNRCSVRIDGIDSLDGGDGFPSDDMSVFAIKRSDPERVLFVHASNDTRSALYFGAALAAASQSSFTLQSIDSDKSTDIDPTRYAFVVLSDVVNLPSIFENTLTRYVRGGGNVLLAVGTSAAHHAHIPVFGGETTDAHVYTRNGYATVGQVDETHPAIMDANGRGANSSGWADLKIYYAAGVDASQARVLARLSDRTPLLLEKQLGEGHVLLFASGFDNLTNDLPVQPAFVPFVDRAARYLAGSENVGGSMPVGSFVPLRAAGSGNAATGVEILDPDGHRPLSLADAAKAQSFELGRAGFYQIRFANGHTALVGVNPDRRESDLQPIPRDLLALWGSHSATPAAAVSAGAGAIQQNSAHSLWWYVMLLVLLTAVAESVVASRYLGTQREEA